MDIARRSTDHYASVDQTRFDGNFGYYGGDMTRTSLSDSLVDGPEHKNHIPGNFWKGGPLHWANTDYGMDQTIALGGITGSIPDPIGLLRAWFIDANRWAKAGYEQWNYAVRRIATPGVTGITASKESIGTFVNMLLSREYTHDPLLSPQIDAYKTALAIANSSKTATFTNGSDTVTITSHGYRTGQRVSCTTAVSLPHCKNSCADSTRERDDER